MKRVVYLISFYCTLTLIPSITIAGDWLPTKVESDFMTGSGSQEPDGVIDSVNYIQYADDGCPTIIEVDVFDDSVVDTISYTTCNAAEKYQTTDYDFDNDGTIDASEKVEFDDNGFPVKTTSYDSEGDIGSIAYHTNDANGNCIKSESDEDADGDIDSVIYNTYDNGCNNIKEERDKDNDGVIDSVDNYSYDENGVLVYSEHETLGLSTACIYSYTFDGNGNKETEDVYCYIGTLDTMEYHITDYYTWEYFDGAEAGDSCKSNTGTGNTGDPEVNVGTKTRLTGNVTYKGTAVTAMIIANGKYMFTGGGAGAFDLSDVPFDSNGQITLYAFCSGLAPYKTILTEGVSDFEIEMVKDEGGKRLVVTIDSISESSSKSGWYDISGTVENESGTPLTALILVNGQYMFTGNPVGEFNLTVPLDGSGKITLYGFCSGIVPYKIVGTPVALGK